MASAKSARVNIDLYDYIYITCNYTWGSWTNNQITLTVNSTAWEGNITGPKSADAVCNVCTDWSSAPGRVNVFTNRNFINVRDGICQMRATNSNCSGSATVKSSYRSGNYVKVEYQLNMRGTIFVVPISVPVPAIVYGKPTVSTSVYNITQTTATRRATIGTYGNNATSGSWTWTYGPGNYNYNSGGSTIASLTGLTPDTTYNYKMYAWNNGGQTTTYQNTFRTLPYTPPSTSISLNSVTNNSITMNHSSSGANVTQLRIYVNGNLWKTISAGNSGTFTVDGLSPKTTYSIKAQAYTPNGSLWGAETRAVSATTYPNPVSVNTNNTKMIEILPFSAKVSVVSSNAGDTASYGYTLLNANKGVIRSETTSTGSTYNWTSLTPETTYYARVRVFTKTSGVASPYYDIKFTTPPDQATVFLKVNNLWRRGKVFLKAQGSWIKSKYIYTKVDGQWRKNNNF